MPRNLTLQKSWKDMEQGNIKAIVEELEMGGTKGTQHKINFDFTRIATNSTDLKIKQINKKLWDSNIKIYCFKTQDKYTNH